MKKIENMKKIGSMKKIKSMKNRSVKILIIGLIIIGLFAQASFAGTEIQGLATGNHKEPGSEALKAVPQELIVTIAKNSDFEDEKLSRLEHPVTKQFKNIENKGFEVKDAVIKQPKEGVSVLRQKGITPFEEEVIANSGHIYLVEYDQKYSTWQEAKIELENSLIKNGVQVKHIEPNYEVQILGESIQEENPVEDKDSELNTLEQDTLGLSSIHNFQKWNYDMINLQQAWGVSSGSSSVSIAVLDTGIDHNHESLKNLVATELGKNFSTSGTEKDTMDRQGHGTHVAGTIASYNKVSGVMQQAKLIPVKVINDNGSGSQYGIVKGIYYAVEQGADVINMSIGSKNYNSAYEEATNFAVENGVIVVGAAGNDGVDSLYYPAGYASVIGVGSLDKDGVRSDFSNYGEGLELMAPGRTVYSTTPGNNYRHYSGTSMAAPHVAGVVGLMRSVNPEITVGEVRSILSDTAAYSNGKNPWEYGKGLVNAEKALLKTEAERLAAADKKDSNGIRIAGANRYETAYNIAKINDPNPETVIIVRGDSVNGIPQVVDGLTASGLAGAKNAQILLVTPNSIPSSTKTAIQGLKPQNAIVVGGSATISNGVVNDLKALGLSVTRVSGKNRYATAAEVALEMGSAKDRTALIVNGHAYVDSLVAGPLAHQGYPILMVNNSRGQVPEETLKAIEALGIEELILIGGEGVISKDLEGELNRLKGVQVKARLGGKDRVSTSLMVGAHESYKNVKEVSIVNGHSYVDAVAASTLGSPVVYYTERIGISGDIQEYLQAKELFQAIGGTSIICIKTYAAIESSMIK